MSEFTTKLFERYRWQLGTVALRTAAAGAGPARAPRVKELLQLEAGPVIPHTIKLFKMLEWLHLKPLMQRLLLPAQYLQEIRQLEQPEAA
jgi:hypothetical protein